MLKITRFKTSLAGEGLGGIRLDLISRWHTAIGIQPDNTAEPNCSTTIKMLPNLNVWFKFCLMALVRFFCSRGSLFFFLVLSTLFAERYFILVRLFIGIFLVE